MAGQRFSLATNACASDLERLRLVIPHWTRVFGDRLGELVIVLDDRPPWGRIARQHEQINEVPFADRLAAVSAELDRIRLRDERIVVHPVPQGLSRRSLIRKWFGDSNLEIDRCQAGSPILAFVAALDAGRFPIVVRADCDMLLYENGWLKAGFELLERDAADLVEPARCGRSSPADWFVSTRIFMVARAAWGARILPLRPARLDYLRGLHRRLQGKPTWLALEQTLDRERLCGRIRYVVLPASLGCTLHVARRDQAALPMMPCVVEAMERGRIPLRQSEEGTDFCPSAWIARTGAAG